VYVVNWIRTTAALSAIACGVFAGVASPLAALADWPMFDRDSARTGFAAGDTAISLQNVGRLHRRWVAAFDAPGDGAPILVSNVPSFPNASRTLLFQETLVGTTYALNAVTGHIAWKRKSQGPNITNSMPAEDPSGQYIYAPGVDGHVHKLAIATGKEFRGGGFPLRVTWSPQIEKDGTSLNVANGYLYAATGGYLGDGGQYDGHVVAINLQNGQVNVVNSLCYNIHQLIRTPGQCPFSKSGIWARGGVVVDPDPSMSGRIYAATGNGRFDANQGGQDYGDSVLAMSADGSTLVDSFTPTDYQQLENGDVDLGSTAPVMLPKQSTSNTPLMAVEGGKDGILKLLNRQHLGGVGGELADYNLGDSIFTAPAVWTDTSGVTWIFVGTSSVVTALQVVTSNGTSNLKFVWSSPAGGTSPAVANGIVFAATSGAVYALDARNGNMVWSSNQPSAGGSIGNVHWESPIVDKGWLYMSDENGNLTAYSL
jgi:outer membrane protein assembly factor BamB